MKRQSRTGFMRTMLSIAIPVTLQNLLFSSLTFIDTLMIGTLGDTPLAAVGMAGKWTWFLGIVLFGFTSGASVFIAQFFGANDVPGIRRTYGLMSIGTLGAALLFMLPALLIPERIVLLFTRDPEAIQAACVYLRIVALAYPFQAIRRAGGMLLESTQRVVIPFVSAIVSVVTNVVLNALLIFGLCGFPALGVAGGAIATVCASAADALLLHVLGRVRPTQLRMPLADMLRITPAFERDYARIAAPAMLNETLWALSYLLYCAIYGHMSTQAYAAITVVKAIEDLTCVMIFGLGSSCAVMIGSYIGRGDCDTARRCAVRHLQLTVGLSVLLGAGLILARGGLLAAFDVSAAVRADAAAVLVIFGLELALHNLPYMLVVGIFRAGGDTRFALLTDSACAYLLGIPLTALAGLALHLSVPATYLIMYLSEDALKVVIYGRHFLSGRWIRPVVNTEQEDI